MGDIPIPEFIQNLSDGDLRTELGKIGVKAGPITPTTRRLFQGRLARKLAVVSAFQSVKSAEDNNQNTASKTEENSPENSISKAADKFKGRVKYPESTSSKNSDEKQLFYGIFLSKSDSDVENFEPIVFESKSSTLLSIKENKNARFKVFGTFEEAKNYSLKGVENISGKNSTPSISETEEIGNKFPSLKQEDLNKLMRSIESGNQEEMKKLIWSNPKHLISSADGPVVLKASARYNALHIAAKSNKPKICREILSLVENMEFHSLVFPNVNDENVNKQRVEHLLDSFLNTPEKILFETPLHFACKLGFKDVVAELLSYSHCLTTVKNKYGQTPSEIICSRASSDFKANKAEIEQLLGDQYFVPLLRYHDNSEHAIVGTPITGKQKPEEGMLISPKLMLNLVESSDSPLRPDLNVSALAGPMGKEQAFSFQKSWTTPSKRKDLSKSVKFLRRTDSEKGDEQIGRQLAVKEQVGWVEHWDFLEAFANFTTDDGLLKLENFLRQKLVFSPPHPKESWSQDISDLASMLQNVHLSHSVEDLPLQGLQTEKQRNSDSTESSYSSYETAPETISPQLQNQKKDLILMTPKSHRMGTQSNLTQDEDALGRLSSGGPPNIEDSSLVKKLFTENSIDNVTENFSKNLRLDPKNGHKSTSHHTMNSLSYRNSNITPPSNQYRCPSESYSDVYSSPSISDVSQSSSATDQSQKNSQSIFLAGPAPTKLDRDVLIAIGETCVEIGKYPAINKWKSAVLAFSETERQKWATPRKQRIFSFNTHHSDSTPSGTSHYSPLILTPSSGRINPLLTPNRDTRRFVFKPFTPPISR